MTIQINNKNNKKLGVVEFLPTNEPVFVGEYDSGLKDFVYRMIQEGITRIVDRPLEADSLTMVVESIDQADPNFPIAFKEFLEKNDYVVLVKYPEVEERIRQLLTEFPDDNPDKIDILQGLPEMSYLEQTIILDGLEKIKNQA